MVTSDVMVFTKNPKRWFDLDAERAPVGEFTRRYSQQPPPVSQRAHEAAASGSGGQATWVNAEGKLLNFQGAPLLDWWEIPETNHTTGLEEPHMTARYLIGDVLELAATLEPGSVDLIVSSPPFLAVRSYLPADHPDKAKEGGQQSTPGGYIDWLISVVEALAPTLAPHGSLVFELGDTYAGSGGAGGDYAENGWRDGQPTFRQDGGSGWPRPKSKSLIPELFRLALTYGFNPLTGRTTDRWILRNVITWCRPNPTPGALGDKVRPATSDIAVFTRSGRRWFDLDAERTPHIKGDPATQTLRMAQDSGGQRADHGQRFRSMGDPAGAPLLDYWVLPPGGYSGAHYAVMPKELVRRLINLMCPMRVCVTCGEPSRRIVETSGYLRKDGVVRGTRWSEGGALTQAEQAIQGHFATKPIGSDATRTAIVDTLGWSDCGHDNWRDGMVLDPFAGSGTTLAVASGMGRDSIGIDLDERNLELARSRVGMFLEDG